MNPTISVITSTYYRNDLLREAIESVLSQEYDPVELIVVDDSGEHHAEPVLQEYDDVHSIVMDEEKGWSTAYTTGIEASSGEYIQLLDDDDYLLEGKLQKTAEVLEQNPAAGLSYCGVVKGDEGCFEPNPEVSGDFLENALRFGTFPLWTGSMLIERDVLMDCLPLAEYAGDTDLKIELALRTEVDYVDECLAHYRQEQNRKWVGLKKFREVKRVVRNQQELYDQYPEIREDLLASWYKRQGFNWLDERLWSPEAVVCFVRSAYHESRGSDKVKTGLLAGASLLGRPGLNTTLHLRDRLGGSGGDSPVSSS